jgi:hypothetical protein
MGRWRRRPPAAWRRETPHFTEIVGNMLPLIVAVICAVFSWSSLSHRALCSETALIRMVIFADSGEKVSVRHGFRLGCRPALRIFLIDLLIGLAALPS